MATLLHPGDPANDLWRRCADIDLEKFWHLLSTYPVKVGEVAQTLALGVVSKTLPSEISGLIRFVSGNYHIEINNTDPGVRQRFTVAHEVSHYLLHRSYIDSDGITDNILYRSKLSNKQEAEANRLAAAILLPWTLVNNWHVATFGEIPHQENVELIARTFKVSQLAVGYRLGL